MGHEDHKHSAEEAEITLDCAVITISDTRTKENDHSGKTILSSLEKEGHRVTAYHIIRDEPDQIVPLVEALAETCQLILLTGGTGITRRDQTYEAISSLLEKKIDGFGELFRFLSYEEIGSAAMLSRAMGGIYREAILFSMPGSPAAVELAMQKLILPELRHMVWMLRGSSAGG